MYKYETHLHTCPVSVCTKATVRESLRFYKDISYDGVFITNHFIDGNIGIDKSKPYSEKIEFCFFRFLGWAENRERNRDKGILRNRTVL